MPTISANVTKKELDAIREFANACGETMSNLIRKVMISEAIYRNGFGGPKEYECNIRYLIMHQEKKKTRLCKILSIILEGF